MNDIDFLPIEYRQRREQRQSQPWQIVAAAAIVGLVVAAAAAQHFHRHTIEKELAAITPVHEAAVKLQIRLGETRKRLDEAKSKAELYTYLRHPWPRTQILATLVESLPKEITLEQVQVSRQPPVAAAAVEVRKPVDKNAEAQRLKSLAPADRDLLKLRGSIDPMRTVVVLTGAVAESSVLHRYLGDLDARELFEKAELDCLTGAENGHGVKSLEFRAVLTVQPGYGQPGGPKGIAKNGKTTP